MSVQQPERERSADTRQRLIEAGLDLFGRLGFEATTTRALAERAGVNLAAIPYHFGGKEGLYQAVAGHIVASVKAAVAPLDAVALAERAHALSPAEARNLIHTIVDRLASVLIGSTQGERWARIFIREQMAPTSAFKILYDGIMGPNQVLLTALLATLRGDDPEEPRTAIRVMTLVGQIIVFRAARAAVMRRMGWETLGDDHLDLIKAVLHENLDAMIDGAGRT